MLHSNPKFPLARILFFGGFSSLAIFFGFFAFDYPGAVFALRHFSIFLLASGVLLFLYWGTILLARHSAQILPAFRNRVFAIAFPLVALGFIVNQPLGYKVVMDEIVLAGTARQIFEEAEPFAPTGAVFENNQVKVVKSTLDKRGLLFPFLVATTHHATGYRVANAFYLNVAFTLLILAIFWSVGFARAGPVGGLLGLLLPATLPLLAMTGTSGGFETLNLLFLLFFYLGVMAAFHDRDSTSLSFLCATTLLLAQLRYESVLFAGVTALVILIVWWLKRRVILPLTLVLLPVLFLNIPWQNEIFKVEPESYQLHSKPGKEAVFSWENIPENLGHALNFFLSTDPNVPNSLPLFLLGLPCVFISFLILRKKLAERRISSMEVASLVLLLSLSGHFLTMMLYFWGQYDDPVIFRLSLPTWLLFWIAVILVGARWLSKRKRLRLVVLGSLAIFWVTITLPQLAKHRYSITRFAPQVFEQARQWAGENRDKRILFISDHAILWIIEGFPAVDPSTVADWDKLLKDYREDGVYDEILTFSVFVLDPKTKVDNLPESIMKAPEWLNTESFYRHTIDSRGGFELRRVVGFTDIPMDEVSDTPSVGFLQNSESPHPK